MWGRGLRGNNVTYSALYQISVTYPATHKQSGPFWCWFPSGWACVHSRTLWVSPKNSPVRLRVSPTASSTPTDVFNQWFEALFPTLELWVAQSVTLSTSCCLASQSLPCLVSSLPGCPSSPLLLVWMNVCSLTPWLLDFHTVRFSVSSGCFLFLNCCCPSFGCMRRHGVSTYASILARSLQYIIFIVL